jgi:chemotaxis protein methyltransferase CheR
MNAKLFEAFRDLAYGEAGILLSESKESLVSSRIQRRVRDLGLPSEVEYLAHLRADKTGAELVRFLDAISTNFTSFFREPAHFQVLADEARALLERKAKRIRVWCAAAATGEEPYSLAITLSEVLGESSDFRILATDISVKALETASEGRYTLSRLSQVPRTLRDKYFVKERATNAPVADSRTAEPEEATYRVSPALRSRIVFKRLNLAAPPFPMKGELDVVFCRNVMIYFDRTVRQRLVGEVERLLKPGGLFVVAHAETLSGVQSGFSSLKPSLYRKPGAP